MSLTFRRRLRYALAAASLALLLGAAISAPGTASAGGSQVLATLVAAHPVHAAPAAKARVLSVLPALTPITRTATTVPVLAVRGGWLLVRLPGRPNGHTGWISAARTHRSVTFWKLVVHIATRTVTVDWGGRPVRVFEAVVGAPATATPFGSFFVEEALALGPAQVGAPFALALSARSNVFQEFDGGPGQIAIHGLDNVGGVPGTAASHGCIRVTDADVRWLGARIGPGVPVTIAR